MMDLQEDTVSTVSNLNSSMVHKALVGVYHRLPSHHHNRGMGPLNKEIHMDLGCNQTIWDNHKDT